MQTFLPYTDVRRSAQVLDDKRLGKQRLETIQIARCLLIQETKWSKHPAVRMWKGFEPYLIRIYLKEMLDEFGRRCFKNEKCLEHFQQLFDIVKDKIPVKPPWITEELCRTHRSRLIQKYPEYYRRKFPNDPDNLEYLWPVELLSK